MSNRAVYPILLLQYHEHVHVTEDMIIKQQKLITDLLQTVASLFFIITKNFVVHWLT